MDAIKLRNILSLGEGASLEFRHTVAFDVGCDICAFANSGGGLILIGVTDDARVVGILDHNNVSSNVRKITDLIAPEVQIDINSVKSVLCISIPEQNSRPYSFNGEFYIRVGESTIEIPSNQIHNHLAQDTDCPLDESPCLNFDLYSDLTPEKWKQFARQAKISTDMNPVEALDLLNLVKNGKIVHAGVWLLAKNIDEYTLNAGIKCTVYMGATKSQIIDQKYFHQDIYSNLEDCISYIKGKLNTALIQNNSSSAEQLELPETALQAAMLCAVVNRDYHIMAPIQINILYDRLELLVPDGIQRNSSIKRPINSLLFAVLGQMGQAKILGLNFSRIKEMCLNYGLQAPALSKEGDTETITFFRKALHEGSFTKHVEEKKIHHVATQDSTRVAQKVQNLINVMDGEVSRSEILEKLQLKDRVYVMKEYLHPALEEMYIEMTIPEKPRSRNQKYKLTEKGLKIKSQLDRN